MSWDAYHPHVVCSFPQPRCLAAADVTDCPVSVGWLGVKVPASIPDDARLKYCCCATQTQDTDTTVRYGGGASGHKI